MTENNIRAIIYGFTREQILDRMSEFFVGKDAREYARESLEGMPETILGEMEVVGKSMKDCYEIALGKKSRFVGSKAGDYELTELNKSGFRVRVVGMKEFDELLERLSPDQILLKAK